MEQNLIEDLVIESIKIYGHDVFYCPRTIVAKNEIYGEDSLSKYQNAYPVEVYIKSYDSYEGDGQFLSKFNLEIRDQVTFTIAVKTFLDEVSVAHSPTSSYTRPLEGDLIYLPMASRLFAIKFVNKTPVFYQMGSIQMYDLVAEVFEYSNESLNTGITEIDDIEKNYTLNSTSTKIVGTFNLDTQAGDSFADNSELQSQGNNIIDFTEIDPFSEGVI
jgi:hypothetical protein